MTNARTYLNVGRWLTTVAIVSVIMIGSQGSHADDTPGTGIIGSPARIVPFVTDRIKTNRNEPARFYGSQRGERSTGQCVVSQRSLKALGTLAQNAPFYIPAERLTLHAINQQPVASFWGGLKQSSNGDAPLLYVHGSYTSFAKSCKQASLFQASLGLEGRLVLFSWPSDGALLNYTRDEADLYWSVEPLENTIGEMVERLGAGNFDIAAHSLGSRGVFLALVNLANKNPGSGPIVDKVVFFAPDIDAGLFRQQLGRIRPLARNITIYVSSNDRALPLARNVHGHPRLGESGEHLAGLGAIEIIDISDVSVRFPFGHAYHLYHNGVVGDVNELLIDGLQAADRTNLRRVGANRWRLQPPS
jgi:esterase/lipase superfamily enzyme